MMSRAMVVIASLTGALVIYCGGDAAHHLLDGQASRDGGGADGGRTERGALVSDAAADDGVCCKQPANTFTKIASGQLTSSTATSAVIPTAGYREVVIYINGNTLETECAIGLSTVTTSGGKVYAEFRPDSSTDFGTTSLQNLSGGGRIQVNGSDLRLFLDRAEECIHSGQLTFTVAGVQ